MLRDLVGRLFAGVFIVMAAACASTGGSAAPQHQVGLAQANGVSLAYESYGDANDPAIVMIQGLGVPLTGWPQRLIEDLVGRGYRVVVFDNRDTGLSSKMDALGDPDFAAIFAAQSAGAPLPLPYTLQDLAADTVGLMDALNIRKAHVVGVSMGGQIAQLTAIAYPGRVLSLTSIMTDTGNPQRQMASPELFAQLSAPPPPGADFEQLMRREIANTRLTAGSAFPRTDADYRADIDRSLARAPAHPQGTGRHLAAGMALGDRRAELARLTMPVVVVHGEVDPLIPVSNAREQASVIHSAELVIIPGMGHETPPGAAPQLAAAIAKAVVRGEAAR